MLKYVEVRCMHWKTTAGPMILCLVCVCPSQSVLPALFSAGPIICLCPLLSFVNFVNLPVCQAACFENRTRGRPFSLSYLCNSCGLACVGCVPLEAAARFRYRAVVPVHDRCLHLHLVGNGSGDSRWWSVTEVWSSCGWRIRYILL